MFIVTKSKSINERKPTYLYYEISWLLTYLLLFTNLESDIPFYNIGLLAMGVFIVIGASPTRFLKYFLKSKLFIAIKFLIRHITRIYIEQE